MSGIIDSVTNEKNVKFISKSINKVTNSFGNMIDDQVMKKSLYSSKSSWYIILTSCADSKGSGVPMIISFAK